MTALRFYIWGRRRIRFSNSQLAPALGISGYVVRTNARFRNIEAAHP